jgi:hypothetical protein
MNKLTVVVQSAITHLTSLFVPEVVEILRDKRVRQTLN